VTSPRDALLLQLADGRWHSAAELSAAATPHGVVAWIRLLRLSGFTIDERLQEGVVVYRLVLDDEPRD
jgi:biotin operon repressor